MAVSMKRQCTARCLQRGAPRNYCTIGGVAIAAPSYSLYISVISAKPHVASNVRYIALQWERTPFQLEIRNWPCNEYKHPTHTPSSNVRYVT